MTRRPCSAIRRVRIACALALLLLPLHAGSALAVTSQTWRQREKADFEKGEPKGTALTAAGTVRLSPRLEVVFEAGQPYLWALAEDARGTVYAAGGNDGIVYRIPVGGKAEVFFRADEPEVHALAVDASGNLYAGTAPRARVYKIAPDGKRLWVYDTGEQYVWTLVFDRQGTLHAGTGVEGRVLRIDSKGRGQVFFDSAETHVRVLLPEGDGNLLAGTDAHGLIFRISPRGEGFVVYDAPLNEIVALAYGTNGALYAAAAGESGRGAPKDRPAPPAPPPPPQPQPVEGVPPQGAPPPAPPEGGPPPPTEQRVPIGMEGRLYAVSPDGYAREIWSGAQEAILSLAPGARGVLLMGSSSQGKIYLLDEQDQVDEVARASSSQVTAILPLAGRAGRERASGGEVVVAGSNFGTLSLLGPGYAASGTYESRLHDARSFATWGRIAWRADLPKGTGITLASRCGNTESPDRTWSEWSTVTGDSRGALLPCPASRFAQWRAELTTRDPRETPVLREVALTYLPKNLPPEIRKVEVQPPGVAYQEVPGQPGQGGDARPAGGSEVEGARRRVKPQSRRGFEPGARTITWQGSDPNEDDLVYDVTFRAIDETAWKGIRTKIDEEFVTLDTFALPDGTYVVRIVGSDAPSNPPGQALTTEKLSDHFDVDNTPPRIDGLRVQVEGDRVRLTFAAVDTFNNVREVAASVDAGEWVPALPVDGLNDAPEERFEIVLGPLPPGEHSLVVRAVDAAGNSGAGKAVVTIAGRAR